MLGPIDSLEQFATGHLHDTQSVKTMLWQLLHARYGGYTSTTFTIYPGYEEMGTVGIVVTSETEPPRCRSPGDSLTVVVELRRLLGHAAAAVPHPAHCELLIWEGLRAP